MLEFDMDILGVIEVCLNDIIMNIDDVNRNVIIELFVIVEG